MRGRGGRGKFGAHMPETDRFPKFLCARVLGGGVPEKGAANFFDGIFDGISSPKKTETLYSCAFQEGI